MESIIDFELALEQLDGDVPLLQEVIGIFMERAPAQLDAIEQAVAAGAAAEVAVQAHGLKGGAANFAGLRFADTALELETLGREGTLVGAEDLLARLRNQYGEIEELLEETDWAEVGHGEPVG